MGRASAVTHQVFGVSREDSFDLDCRILQPTGSQISWSLPVNSLLHSATTGFVNSPSPSTLTVTTSPTLSHRLGERPMPTPPGVPVETTSPGSSGVMDEMYSINSGT